MMKNSKLKFSEYMQSNVSFIKTDTLYIGGTFIISVSVFMKQTLIISRSKSFGLIVYSA